MSWETALDNLAGHYVATLEVLYGRLVKQGRIKVESPIEEMMALGFIGMGVIIQEIVFDAPDLPVGTRWAEEYRIFPQHKVDNFRVDFAVRVTLTAKPDESRWIAVECDGHNYHERTPDQAERDRSRDRHFASLGWTVLRFTGREIHRDVGECLMQVIEHAQRLAKEMGA